MAFRLEQTDFPFDGKTLFAGALAGAQQFQEHKRQPIRLSEDLCGLPFPTPQRHPYKLNSRELGKPNDNG